VGTGLRAAVALACAALAAGCDPAPTGPPSLLPADLATRFVTVRDCRPSIDHDLRRILIRVETTMTERYERGPYPLPPGTLIVKEEFDDPDCATRAGWTLMQKQPPGYDARSGDWRWQRLDAQGQVLEDGRLARCSSCHAASACRARDFACAEP
jgi:hypothetical protein